MNYLSDICYPQNNSFENIDPTPLNDGIYEQKGNYCFLGYQYDTKFYICYKNGKLMYIKNGSILRIVPINDITNPPQIMFDLEQVKYLLWEGEKGNQEQCIGKWKAKWKYKSLNIGGLYNECGIKIGKWSELGNHVYGDEYLINVGEYKMGRKQSIWETILYDKIIGFGVYNEFGIKYGKWFEPIQSYSDTNIAIWIGNYYNGKKIEKWDAIYKKSHCHTEFIILGGGNYTDDGIKDGYWIDFDDTNQHGLFAVKIGQYSSGAKIGKWVIQYQDQIIGGGYYDEQGYNIGEWVEIHEKFNWKRYGYWHYLYSMTTFMGCGCYDENGNKQGKWIELFQNFCSSCLITEEGEYKNGKRVGLWNIVDQNKIISGGIYNEKGDKNGIWNDLHDNFSCFCQISYQGQYKFGIKVGQWKTIYESERHLGGGIYNEKGMRNGIWIDLDDNFDRNLYQSQFQYIQNYEYGQKKGEMVKQTFI